VCSKLTFKSQRQILPHYLRNVTSFIEGVKWVAKRNLGTSYLLCKMCEASHRMGLWSHQMLFAVTIV